MSDNKLLQAILDKVSTLDKKVSTINRKVDDGFKKVDQRFDETEKNLTARIDKLGLQIANLEDDAPTLEEYDKLEDRVGNLEKQLTSV